jgi:hypothetical protein
MRGKSKPSLSMAPRLFGHQERRTHPLFYVHLRLIALQDRKNRHLISTAHGVHDDACLRPAKMQKKQSVY